MSSSVTTPDVAIVGVGQTDYRKLYEERGVRRDANGLAAEALRLPVVAYDPAEHYGEVTDKWYGVRTPDGR